MPIYEYQCATCGKVTDLKHAFREEPPTTTCPACGATPLKRIYNAAGIVFKGSGFYINDSRSSKGGEKPKTEPAATPAAAPAAAAPAASTQATPAAPTSGPPKSDAAA